MSLAEYRVLADKYAAVYKDKEQLDVLKNDMSLTM